VGLKIGLIRPKQKHTHPRKKGSGVGLKIGLIRPKLYSTGVAIYSTVF
jgi:hypothetical protein